MGQAEALLRAQVDTVEVARVVVGVDVVVGVGEVVGVEVAMGVEVTVGEVVVVVVRQLQALEILWR